MVLFVSDLDGTLLDNESRLDPGSIEKLNSMIEAGIHFTIATARAYPSIISILEGLDLRLPIIEQNGALVRGFSSGHVVEASIMSAEDVAKVCTVFEEYGVDPIVSVLEGDENAVFFGRVENTDMEWCVSGMLKGKGARRMVFYDGYDPVIGASVLLVRYLGSETVIRAMATRIMKEIPGISVSHFHNFYTRGWEINISSLDANKGRALQAVRPYAHGISKVVVFGDSDNDLDMFDHADEAYAVANATSAIRLKASAVIGPNTEKVVVRFMEQHARTTY